jgi:hypothetical protein
MRLNEDAIAASTPWTTAKTIIAARPPMRETALTAPELTSIAPHGSGLLKDGLVF